MATYYVDATNGSDGGTGEIASPWLTVGKVNSTAIAGDTIRYLPGTYGDARIEPKDGQTHEGWGVVLRAALPVFAGGGTRDALFMNGKSGVTLRRLKLTNTYQGTWQALHFQGACPNLLCEYVWCYSGSVLNNTGSSGTNIVYNNCRFEETFGDGFHILGSGTYTLNRCVWYRTGGDTGTGASDPISAHDSANFTVNDGWFENCQRGAGLSIGTGTKTFNRCFVLTGTITGGQSTAGIIFSQNEAGGTMNIRNCKVILKGTNALFCFISGLGTMNVENCSVLNVNTNVGTMAWVVNGTGTLRTKNSISRIGTGGAGVHAVYAVAGTYDEDYCRYYPDGASLFNVIGTPGNFAAWDAVASGSFSVDNSAVADPGFTDTTGGAATPGALDIGASSPMIGAGSDLSANFTTDFYGQARGTSGQGSFDIGAHEYTPSHVALSGDFEDVVSLRGTFL